MTNIPMKAARISRFGTPEVIVLQDVARPKPAWGEVLVRVKAAGVGPWDALIRSGHSTVAKELPMTLGSDLSGTVELLGPGVAGLSVGDEVFGVTNHQFTGAYAEFAIAHSDTLARKPASLTFIEAASVPVIAVTASKMLFEHAQVRPGQRVLIHGAGGNVGAYAVRLADLAGAHVMGTASERQRVEVFSLGADEVVSARDPLPGNWSGQFDAVIDTVGGDEQVALFGVIKPGGVLVSAVSQPDVELARAKRVKSAFFIVEVASRDLEALARQLDSGEVWPRIGSTLPLANARDAHEMLDGRRPKLDGKIVLRTADDL